MTNDFPCKPKQNKQINIAVLQAHVLNNSLSHATVWYCMLLWYHAFLKGLSFPSLFWYHFLAQAIPTAQSQPLKLHTVTIRNAYSKNVCWWGGMQNNGFPYNLLHCIDCIWLQMICHCSKFRFLWIDMLHILYISWYAVYSKCMLSRGLDTNRRSHTSKPPTSPNVTQAKPTGSQSKDCLLMSSHVCLEGLGFPSLCVIHSLHTSICCYHFLADWNQLKIIEGTWM